MNDRPSLSESELDEIERLARTDVAEAYRGPLLALVDEVRRLRPRSGVNPHGAPR